MTDAKLSDLYTAQVLMRNLTHAQNEIDTFLKPYLKQYADLLLELNPNYDKRDLNAVPHMSFKENDANHFFLFEAEEVYDFGDYHIPSLSLPFDFVEDPEGYSARHREEIEKARKTKADRERKNAQAEVLRLEAQLAIAKKRAVL